MSSRQARRALLDRLVTQDVGQCTFDEPLSDHNSWQIGGPVDLLIEPGSAEQVAAVVRFVNQFRIPLVVIGQGTNLLFDDAGLRGVVLKLGENFSAISIEGNRIIAESGAWVPGLARRAMRAGLSGLEHIIGIPGTIGGLVLMNGGSHRQGIGENVRRVEVVNPDGTIAWLDQADCCFAYRSSALQGTGAVVVGVELCCLPEKVAKIRQQMLLDLRERRRKFPRKLPNCGSVFLSTATMHATVGPPGRIIEEAGLKGTRIGQAEVSRQHANFIVNRGGATSSEILALIRHIRDEVKSQIGFDLQCEVRYVSPEGRVLPAHRAV
ncbi:MAG: UDP-N-acetylmuramate dehydrogenase [Desulfuromonadales bacterium]